MNGIVVYFFSALAVFGLAIPVRQALLHWGVIDHPTARSCHNEPTVRGGGVAILLVILAVAAYLGDSPVNWTLLGLAVCAAFLAAISLVDDIKSVPPLVRFGCHALAAGGAVWLLSLVSLRVEVAPDLNWSFGAVGSVLVGLLLLVGYTNAFNFMDGINGLAAGQAAFTATSAGLLAGFSAGAWDRPSIWFCFVIGGAAAGFLPHNFPNARMFMGDVGSAPLGFLLAALVLWLARDFGPSLLVPLALLHTNFVLDTSVTFLRRLFRGKRVWEPHRDHFYQRLVRSGKSHSFVTGWEIGLQLVVLGLLACYLRANAPLRLGLILCVFTLWGGFFAFCESQFLRVQNSLSPSPAFRHEQPSSKITSPDLPLRS